MPIRFDSLLTAARPYQRYADNGPLDIRQLERALESDRGRIINSAAIRRLQQKTQVFPLERNAAVRSRLTHSLEVQQTGRFIVRTIFDKLGDKVGDYGLTGLERILETLVEMACLMHDIGNPPFGHFGEAAITKWFRQHLPTLPLLASGQGELAGRLAADLSSFEGNAQAIRLLHSLLGLNLTYVQSACVLKYTRPAYEARPDKDAPLSYLRKKPGYYLSEAEFVTRLQDKLGLEAYCRYPLSYLMEAADDISYCLADIEDGVEKGLLSYRRLTELLIAEFDGDQGLAGVAFLPHNGNRQDLRSFRQVIEAVTQRADKEPLNKAHQYFMKLRVNLIHPLVQHAAESFIDNYDTICRGRLNRALLEDDSLCHRLIETFKRVAIRHIFSVAEVETLELQGYRIISELLNQYRPLLELTADDFAQVISGGHRDLLIESRLARRLPNKHVSAYRLATDKYKGQPEETLWEAYYRCRLIQDMLSGMTDQYALDEYQELMALAP
ncbi:dGTPase [Bowmanella dokdonensis]|uniref:Probable deoxyguanosinetriphosphate triphosphohydrolase n=1 Tax=Bowmanella dokdonensis TaxID=751969 RepID=A0A939IRL4_9ALTE|nr:dGTPase [Bowmanella dokdonensis]MBN7826214.1 dGTPase [Bowmanella dokdonensis]